MFKSKLFRFVAVAFGVAILLFTSVISPVRGRLSWNDGQLSLTSDGSLAEGSWKIDLDAYHDNRRNGLQIQIHERPNITRSQYIPSDRAPRLDGSARQGNALNFSIVMDSGEFIFTGAVKKDIGSGDYRFKANPAYATEAGKLLKRDLSTADLIELGFSDVSLTYIRDIADAGIEMNYKAVLSLRHHGVKSQQAKEFAALGFKNTEDIIRLRNHGVQTDFARDASALGYGKKAEDLVQLRNHGVTSEYLKGWKDAGLNLSTEEMIRVRNHGLKADYAVAWKKAGYDLSPDEMIRARNHGIPNDYPAALATNGSRPTVDEAIRLRQNGVDAKYYRAVRELSATYTADEIVRLRQNGVTADYIAALNVPGRPALDAKTIIDLRNRGVSAETARKLRQ